MRKFNHVILDFESHKSTQVSKYWAHKILNSDLPLITSIACVDLFSKFSGKNSLENAWPKSADMTIKFNTDLLANIDDDVINPKHLYSLDTFSNADFKENLLYRSYVINSAPNVMGLLLKQSIAAHLSPSNRSTSYHYNSNKLINVNLLRKERLYTKLKYSRSPAFDIVSGGAAALLAGFLGFLISEKFGFELVDSGDFYFLFMYLVFLSFSVRPLLTTLSSTDSINSLLSVKPIILFTLRIFYLALKALK